jgi:hypothetical protein
MADPLSYFIPREMDDFSASRFATGDEAAPVYQAPSYQSPTTTTVTEPPLEPTPELGDPLSYERDIRPMKKMFFRSAYQAGARDPASLYARNTAMVDASFNAEMQSRANEYRLYQQKMGLDIANLQLQKAREEAERDRNMAANMRPLVAELDALTSDPNLTQEQATMLYGRIGMKYAEELAMNKGAANAYTATGRAITGLEPKVKEGVEINSVLNVVGSSPKGMGVINKYITENPDYGNRVPPSVVGEAMQLSSKERKESESAAEQSTLMTRTQINLLQKSLDDVGEAKLFENPNTKKVDPTKFASPQDESRVASVISTYAPEMVEQMQNATAEQRLKVASDIVQAINTGKISLIPRNRPKAKPAGASWME